MRIIAGKRKGTKLSSPKDDSIRPTTDRIKEAVFNTLQNLIPESKVLDLFCGSGALGIEAWSRGAELVILADKSASSIELAKKNKAIIGNPNEIKIIKKNYVDCIKMFKNSEEFDIVFLDPPYKAGLYENVLDYIIESNILNKDAVIVAETDVNTNIENENLLLWKQKKYGNTVISYYRQINDKNNKG